jgi:hypothetical protein
MRLEEVENQAPNHPAQPGEEPHPEQPSSPGAGPDLSERVRTPDRPPTPDQADRETEAGKVATHVARPKPVGPASVRVRVTRLPEDLRLRRPERAQA